MAALLVSGFQRVNDGFCLLGKRRGWGIVGGGALGVAVCGVSRRGDGRGTVRVVGVVGGHGRVMCSTRLSSRVEAQIPPQDAKRYHLNLNPLHPPPPPAPAPPPPHPHLHLHLHHAGWEGQNGISLQINLQSSQP